MICRRLKARGLNWIYHFPRLGLVDLRPLRDALHEQEGGEGTQEAFAQEEDEAHDRAVNEPRESLDTAYREAVAEARQQPPPPTVQAYQSVYGHFPEARPPVAWC